MQASNKYHVYILTNKSKTVLYTGVTNNLPRRLTEHHQNAGKPKTFAGKYRCHHLIYHESYPAIQQAIAREKEIKHLTREEKEVLINLENPTWKPLTEDFL